MSGPTMFARIGVMRALNRNVERVLPSPAVRLEWQYLLRKRWHRPGLWLGRPQFPQTDRCLLQKATVIAATSTPAALAAKAAKTTIPIVFETGFDPIQLGLVTNLNKPSENITGVTQLNALVTPKRLELLHELVPKANVVGLLVNPTNPTLMEAETNGAMSAAHSFSITLHVLFASNEGDFEGVFAKLTELGAGGLVVGADPLFTTRSARLGEIAARHAMPAVFENRSFAAAGGLASYGGDTLDSYRLTGVYVARILKGEKPADLPVQQGTKLELFINAKSAKALGITIPLPLSGRADEVIE
jgi:putative tryptophan/tyrosine transport system substrate-binding protein